MLISNLTSLRLKMTMKDSILMAENAYIHIEWIEEISSSIKTLIICPSHRVRALIFDMGTCALKRGITVRIFT